jgi:hypothetical protein
VLHDEGGESGAREAAEVERRAVAAYERETMEGLRIARSAIQTLVFAIRQHELELRRELPGLVGSLVVPDHGWVRGEE